MFITEDNSKIKIWLRRTLVSSALTISLSIIILTRMTSSKELDKLEDIRVVRREIIEVGNDLEIEVDSDGMNRILDTAVEHGESDKTEVITPTTEQEHAVEVGDIGLLEIYDDVVHQVSWETGSGSDEITDMLYGRSYSENKADRFLANIDRKRKKKAKEEREFREYIENRFKEKLIEEMDRRNEQRREQYLVNSGPGLTVMGMREELNLIAKSMDTNIGSNSTIGSNILNVMPNYLGKPYIWGGDDYTQKGVGYDCSGFTLSVLNRFGVSIPRVSSMQFTKGESVEIEELRVGDLVFFDTREEMRIGIDKPSRVSHVGLYVGNGIMVHASSGSNRIRTEKVFGSYFAPRYMGARRYL